MATRTRFAALLLIFAILPFRWLFPQEATVKKPTGRATLIEVRRQRCRQARYEKYLAVVELGHQGHTQLAIAETFGIGAETLARWLRASEFPGETATCLSKRPSGGHHPHVQC